MMRNRTFWLLFALLLTMTISTYANTIKHVTVVFKTGPYTEKQAAMIAQQTFNNLSAESIGRFSATANGKPFSYTLNNDRTQLTFDLWYMFDQ